MTLINRLTGREATPTEYAAAERRAHAIITSPYSSPEQVEWALQFPGVADELVFWESADERRLQRYREQNRVERST